MNITLVLLILITHFFFCSNALRVQYEPIQPITQLSIQPVTSPFAGYTLEFYAFNEEFNFQGYRLYQSSTSSLAIQQQEDEFLQNKDFTPTSSINNQITGWCTLQKAAVLNEKIQIQIETNGTTRDDNYHCLISNLTLIPNQFLAIRSGVNRDCSGISYSECFPWSRANVLQIP